MKGYILKNGKVEYCEDHLHIDWEIRKKKRMADFRIEDYYLYLSFAEDISEAQVNRAYQLARDCGAFEVVVDVWKKDKRVFSQEMSLEDLWTILK